MLPPDVEIRRLQNEIERLKDVIEDLQDELFLAKGPPPQTSATEVGSHDPC